MTTSRIAELVTMALGLGGCLFWVGATANDVAANKVEIAAIKADAKSTPTQVAVLDARLSGMERNLQDLKGAQEKTDSKVDQVLTELRRK